MNESGGYALDNGRSFPPIRKGKLIRKGMSSSLREHLEFMRTHTVTVTRDPNTNEPVAIIKEIK